MRLYPATRKLVARNALGNAYIRTIAWRGPETLGIDGRGTQAHVAIAAWRGATCSRIGRGSAVCAWDGRGGAAPVRNRFPMRPRLPAITPWALWQKGRLTHEAMMMH